MNKIRYIQLLCSAAVVFDVAAARAQDNVAPEPAGAAQALEEIVVTARRRAESLQDVPVSVSAISSSELQNNIATDLTKVAELAPQVIIGRQTVGTGAIIGIRGISSTSTDPGLDQSVAVAIDNIVLSRGRIISMAVFDLAQVEVLEGPQALFFGKNSPAGVISLSSANPTQRPEGFVRAGYEFEAAERYVEGAVSGPITDTLSARLAVRASAMDGWIRNVAQPVADPLHPGVILPGANNGSKQPQGHDYAGRVTLLWEPTDDFQANLKVTAAHQRLNAMNAYVESFCTGGQTVPTVVAGTAVIPLPFADCSKNMVKAESGLAPDYAANYPYGNNGVPYYNTDGVIASLNLNKSFGDVTLTSTTGYYQQDHSGTNNADYTPFALIWSAQTEDYELFTQELRLNTDFDSALNFAGGAYYEHSNRFFGNFPDLFHAGINPSVNNYTTVESVANSKTDTFSFFGQVRWKIIPDIELAAGARYSHDKKEQTAVNRAVGVTTLPFRPQGSPIHADYSGDNVSPEVTLSWHPAPRQLIYAAYKTGYKAGAISNPATLLANAMPETLVIDREKADGFEIGYKSDLFDNRMRFNLTAYRYDFEDLQLGTYDVRTNSFNVQNAAAARTEGVQASLNWLAADGLTLSGNVAYNRARYTNFRDAQCYTGQTAAQGCVGGRQDLSGARLNRAPKFTLNVGAEYEAELGTGWKADFAIDGTYTSSYQSAADNAPGGVQPSFWRLNAAVHLMPESEQFRLSVIGRNLTNSYYLITTSSRPAGGPTEYIGVFNRPREVVLQAEYRF